MLLCCFLVTATEQLTEMPTPLECSSQYVTISTFIYRLCIFWLVTHSFMTLYLQSFNMFTAETPKYINRQVPSLFYNRFTFSGNLQHRYETCRSFATNHINIPIFQTKKYSHFSIRASAICSWNYTQDMLKINLSLKTSSPKSIKYSSINILLKVTNSFCRLDLNLHGIYEICACIKLL